MPLYYFHLCNGGDTLLDPDGRDLTSRSEVQSATLGEARSIISQDALEGRIELGYRIDVQDAAGELVHSLRFTDAIKITGS